MRIPVFLRDLLDEIKEYVYWRYIFPYLDYTKKHFDKTQCLRGLLFIRKPESAKQILKRRKEEAEQ